jgi:hypothetical protein
MEEADNMAHAKRYLTVGSLFAVVLMVLFACGGGGGGGGGLDGNLLGTVTDATQMAVEGATVTLYDDTGTGTVVATTTTDAAGRYAFKITTMDNYLVSAEMAPAFFPAGRPVTLVANKTIVADLNLSSTRDRATQTILSTPVVGTVGGTVLSFNFLGAGQASLEIAADSLEASGVTYPGTATVYLTPVDTTRMNSGFANYQFVLPAALGESVPDDMILKIYAAAGVAVVDNLGSALTTPLSAPPLVDPMILSFPIPADPSSLRTDAPVGVDAVLLWKYDPVSDSWSEAGTASRTLVTDPYTAEIAEGGLYAAGVVAAATPVTGMLQYGDSAPAGGVSVRATAADATYRNVTTTDDTGAFSVLVENGMLADIEFTSWVFGVQQTDVSTGAVGPDIGTFVMADIYLSTAATLRLNDGISTGFIPASGRIYVDPDSDLNTAEIADVVFVADTVGGDVLTVQSGKDGDTLLNGVDFASIDIGNAGEVTITVQTVDGQSATLTVDATRNIGDDGWDMTLSSSFSL